MKSTTGTNNMKAKDIKTIIEAGKLANCEKIEYNGLIITYNSKPQSVVADHQFVFPIATTAGETFDSKTPNDHPTTTQPAPDMDYLRLNDPVEYERLIQTEGSNAANA